MEKKELKEILNKQTDEIETRFSKHTQNLEKKFDTQTKDLKEDFHRMGGFLLDEFDKRLSIVAESFTGLRDSHQRLEKKVDATFEMTGKLSEDMIVVKDELGMIRNELKAKVDRDEFVSLEKRVIFLERKMRTR